MKMTTTKPTPTEAHYVALRVIAAMLRDPKVGEAACRHPEVTRSIRWLCTQFDGIEALSEASGLIGKEQRELRKAYEMGVCADDFRSVIARVLNDARCLSERTVGNHELSERLYAAMSSHVADMVKAQIISSRPEDPLPDACLAISSEE
jgi:hypothetical protein